MINRFFKRAVSFVFIGLLLVPGCTAADQKPLKSMAVIEFEAKGVTQLEASTLTDRFRSELVRTKTFVQIERSRIEQIFKEQKLQLSGNVSDDRLVEIGELLGAELLVVGSIGKLGATYTIDLRLVEVESGEILASYFKDYRGEIDGLLGQFRIIADEISRKETSAIPETIPVKPLLVSNRVSTPTENTASLRQYPAPDAKAKRYPVGRIQLVSGVTVVGKNLRITPEAAFINTKGKNQVFGLNDVISISAKYNKAKRYSRNCAGACVGVNLLPLILGGGTTTDEYGNEVDLLPDPAVYLAGVAAWSVVSYGIGYFAGWLNDDWQIVYLNRN